MMVKKKQRLFNIVKILTQKAHYSERFSKKTQNVRRHLKFSLQAQFVDLENWKKEASLKKVQVAVSATGIKPTGISASVNGSFLL